MTLPNKSCGIRKITVELDSELQHSFAAEDVRTVFEFVSGDIDNLLLVLAWVTSRANQAVFDASEETQ